MNKPTTVHIRRHNPGLYDTFAFERHFDSRENAEWYVRKNRFALAPSNINPSTYAVIID